MFYCGIDIVKYKHEAIVIDADGKALADSISFANDRQGCEKILAIFEKFETASDDVVIGIEAAGHYWFSVYTFGNAVFTGRTYDCLAVCPFANRRRGNRQTA